LDKTKIELSVISINVSKNSVFELFCKKMNIAYYRIEYASKWSIPLATFNTYKILKTIQPDAVHCHIFESNLIGLTAAILAGVKKKNLYQTSLYLSPHPRNQAAKNMIC
jgi:hypothetical protein